QKCWRKKKDLEENNTIWGYTTVVDYNKLGWSTFILCLQLKPLTREAADLIIARKHEADIAEEGIIVLDFMITIGKYDGIIVFAAPDLVHAKRYYDTIRHLYADIIVTKPSMMQTMFTPILGGRVNPEMDRIHELVPPMLEGKTRDTNR
ncbi:MAG: hypothetical protein KAT70_08955, partial [Thermoplasmata archaeon]|nr:hypothetical protein [Thermoplasmata archaeon]